MLKNDLYHINTIKRAGEKYIIHVTLNPDHDIFKGHFPEQPVLPGVCLIEMVKELLEIFMETSLQMKSAENVKFLKVVDPNKDAKLMFAIQLSKEPDMLKIQAVSFLQDESVNFKLKANFVESD